MRVLTEKCVCNVSRSIWNHPADNLHTVRHGENLNSDSVFLSQDLVKQDPSERARQKPRTVFYDDSLEGIANEAWLGILFNETSPESSQFPNDTTTDMLHFDRVMKLKEDESSVPFYGIKTEEPTVDINRLLFCTSDESTSVYNSEIPSEISIKDNTTNYSKKGNNMHNIRNINKRYENNTADQLLSSVNVRNYNITSVEDDFYNRNNSFLDSSSKMTDINSVTGSTSIYDAIYNNVLWSETNSTIDTAAYETPDTSRSPSIVTESRNTNLLLDFQEVQFIADEINTPNIIDAIIENEKLDFVTGFGDKIIITTSAPDEFQQSSSSSSEVAASVSPPPGLKTILPVKREYVEYNDEESNGSDVDYVPPTKSKRKSAAARKAIEDEGIFKSGKRGRPPKRNRSISSDDYSQLDPSEARYREMRDRNNEASRKSRFKRKHKDSEIATEMKELSIENIRLNAQVEALQKTVDSYRDNLMKVMLNKKH